jgi:hypothetical protein
MSCMNILTSKGPTRVPCGTLEKTSRVARTCLNYVQKNADS